MRSFESPYFNSMPSKQDLVDRVDALGVGTVRDIQLFRFSACTPAFCVDIGSSKRNSQRLVLRGEQQNDLRVTLRAERSMEKEIYMLKTIRQLGLNAAEVLFDGRIFSVPGRGHQGVATGKFRFFLMEYVEGMAIDRKIIASSPVERLQLLDQVAEIYARIHSLAASEYGVVDRHGQAVNGCTSLRDFLVGLTRDKASHVAAAVGGNLADELRHFADIVVARLWDDVNNSGYQPQPRMVLYDGFCGNMLIQDGTISLIDMALAGYFEPVTEFCAFMYPLSTLLPQKVQHLRYWDHFVDSYRSYGGTLPPTNVMIGLLHVMLVNVLSHHLVYCADNRARDKQSQVGSLCEMLSSLMAERPRTIEDICRSRQATAA